MRIVSNKALRDWRKKIETSECKTYAELKTVFNSVDKAGNYYIFNIAGNNYRLIAAIHFNTQTVYIRAVLTHKEYDQWKP